MEAFGGRPKTPSLLPNIAAKQRHHRRQDLAESSPLLLPTYNEPQRAPLSFSTLFQRPTIRPNISSSHVSKPRARIELIAGTYQDSAGIHEEAHFITVPFDLWADGHSVTTYFLDNRHPTWRNHANKNHIPVLVGDWTGIPGQEIYSIASIDLRWNYDDKYRRKRYYTTTFQVFDVPGFGDGIIFGKDSIDEPSIARRMAIFSMTGRMVDPWFFRPICRLLKWYSDHCSSETPVQVILPDYYSSEDISRTAPKPNRPAVPNPSAQLGKHHK